MTALTPAQEHWLAERVHEQEPPLPGDVRSPFERDYARLIHSAAFRRLQGKTQVMGVGEGDFHRTRLTHSLECAQIGVGLREQLDRTGQVPTPLAPWFPDRCLVETACLAHDLGHPPFGHGGEAALHRCMQHHGGFEGNAHTLRLLCRLEKYKEQGFGLNPTRRLVLAVLKYPAPYSVAVDGREPAKAPKCYFDAEAPIVTWATSGLPASDTARLHERSARGALLHRTFDCSVMELADDVAYGVHDIEDIVARRLADRDAVHAELERAFEAVGGTLHSPAGVLSAARLSEGLFANSFTRKRTISTLVSAFLRSVQIAEVVGFTHPLLTYRAGLEPAHRVILDHLKALSFRLVIDRAHIRQLEWRGQRVVTQLFTAMAERPEQLIPGGSWDDGDTTAPDERRVADYLAGMTDAYAEKVYRRLFETGHGSSRDEL
jgi:dGTPase